MRDLSLIIDEPVRWEQIAATVQATAAAGREYCARYAGRLSTMLLIRGAFHDDELVEVTGVSDLYQMSPRVSETTWVSLDRIIDVSQQEALETARKLAKIEGIFSGVSSGGAVKAAMQLASEIQKGTIVCIICDIGDRYLSTELYL